jgi:hypothetical protein
MAEMQQASKAIHANLFRPLKIKPVAKKNWISERETA